ncbi:MAG TPA: hypothetical protein VGH03_19950 [Caulobacteraceae bacterium]|jgi:hypothetical protein
MTRNEAKDALISVLTQIQKRTGLACPPLDGSSVPPKVLPKFDSTVWPVAITLVARKLNVVIPKDVHVFGGEHGARLLSIDESAALICKKALPKQPEQQAA